MITRARRSSPAAYLLVALAAGLSACGSGGVEQTGTLAAPGQADGAYTYDEALAPIGAEMTVNSTPAEGGTMVELTVSGFEPNREYGAHTHVNPCGETGDAAGAHFQNEQDPVKPSVDPAFANPANEIWLDLTTDAEGAGSATAEVRFAFAERAPGSVVVHEMGTKTGPGEAGTAGGRLACLTVAFEQTAG